MVQIRNKLLILSGPTATGKTSLAVKLALQFNGVIISADSRQVYIGMDIGTGKDHPPNFPIRLIDIITPDQIFSVAQYHRLVLKEIKSFWDQGKLPIVVGGTGQYIESLLNPQPTFAVKPNPFLRFFLNRFSLSVLQKIFSLLDPGAYAGLNNSEKHNPHRLIRKIEIKLSFRVSPLPPGPNFDLLHLQLTAPNNFLYQRIDKRVEDRLQAGLINEIKGLLKSYSWTSPGLNTLAYREFKDYFRHKTTMEEVIKKWKYDEHAYARRQKTYFKRMTSQLLDISRPDYEKMAVDKVERWYN